ncbi:Uncharacterised protein [Serratia fonticola]|uniref:Uncharacterized protein n=1 Tax=Serratia fonticola TaxID=47917 RepID=A0A4U9WM46_SERFO|nr:Uncharacterised protein [Serratia fonticola]
MSAPTMNADLAERSSSPFNSVCCSSTSSAAPRLATVLVSSLLIGLVR